MSTCAHLLLVPSDLGFATESDSLPTRRSLLSRLRRVGDDVSWQHFFDTYWRLIYNVARKSGLSDADAQDVVQETVIAVARKMPDFRYEPSKGSFKQWLLLITRRRIQDHLRRAYRCAQRLATDEHDTGASAEVPDGGLTPDAQIDQAWVEEWRVNFFEAALAEVRAQVNPKTFQAFDLCVLQHVPAPAVARLLGLNAAQVYLAKHRVSRAIQRVARELERTEAQAGAR